MREDAPHQVLALGTCNHPVEEVALDGAVDAGGLKRCARKDVFRVVVAQSKNGECDRFRDDDQKSMLEEQGVALNFATVD
ncbi:MAG: hypothetical protein WCD75_14280 [Rhodoplanes sp.]